MARKYPVAHSPVKVLYYCDSCGGMVLARFEITTASGRPVFLCGHCRYKHGAHFKERAYPVKELA